MPALFDAAKAVEMKAAQEDFARAKDFFSSTAAPVGAAADVIAPAADFFSSTAAPVGAAAGVIAPAAEPPQESHTTSQGTVQFQLIGHKPDDDKYSAIMQENADNLLAMGALVYKYMNQTYPKVDAKKLNIDTWIDAINMFPSQIISLGSKVSKEYHNTVAGTSISGEFLSLVAKALITEGISLLTDFTSYLNAIGNIVYSVNVKGQSYNAVNCTYVNYLVDDQVGGYYDYGALFLRQINFAEGFMEIVSPCAKADFVKVDMTYDETVILVQNRNIRKGGKYYEEFQGLINADATEQFKRAKNFFNPKPTPQKALKTNV